MPILLGLALFSAPVHAEKGHRCEQLMAVPAQVQEQVLVPAYQWVKKKSIDLILNVIGYTKGLPKYIQRTTELQKSGQYLEYDNFGELGLAELGIPVQYSQEKLAALNTGRPLIIVANHHLGIADGLTLQYLSSKVRGNNQPSLLLLARWIEKLLPRAIFGDEAGWGTAIPVEINKPKEDDPEFEEKMAAVKDFNSKWSKTTYKALKNGAAVIFFPAGQVAALHTDDRQEYPNNVYDAEGSWKPSVINLAKMIGADIVFAHVDSVNSENFYRNRKRFGGGDKERVIWFFSEAIKKSESSVDVFFSDPINIKDLYPKFSEYFGHSEEELNEDLGLMAELMRLYTYDVQNLYPQELDGMDAPERISGP